MKHLLFPSLALIAAATLVPQALSAQIINIDFLAQRTEATAAPNYVGVGAAGGGTTFNGLAADDTALTDNITVSGSGLLGSYGHGTSVGFSITPIGADNPQDFNLGPVNGGYLFANSANNAGQPPADFTISGLGSATVENLFFTTSNVSQINIPSLTFTFGGGTPVAYTTNGIYDGFNTYEFANVKVVGGVITGTFGTGVPSDAVILSAVTIESAPEPGTWAMMVGGLAFLGLCIRRKYAAAKV